MGIAAFAVTYSVVRRQTGFDLLVAFRWDRRGRRSVQPDSGPSHGLWAWQNLWDFAFGMGIGQAIIALTVLGDGLIEWRHTRLVSAATWLSASLLAVVVATDLIGVNRGEVVRLWIFLGLLSTDFNRLSLRTPRQPRRLRTYAGRHNLSGRARHRDD